MLTSVLFSKAFIEAGLQGLLLKLGPNLAVHAPRIPCAVDHYVKVLSFSERIKHIALGGQDFKSRDHHFGMHNDFVCGCLYICVCVGVCVIMCVLCTVVYVKLIVHRESGMVLGRNRRGSFIDSLVLTWACLKAVSLDATHMLPWVKSPEQHQ